MWRPAQPVMTGRMRQRAASGTSGLVRQELPVSVIVVHICSRVVNVCTISEMPAKDKIAGSRAWAETLWGRMKQGHKACSMQ